MAEKVTRMLIKVDLECSRCCKKIQKVLCEIPQVRDRTYDEEENTVSITVVCCSPEKIQQKIICKGGETVLSVEILPDKDTKKPKKVTFALPPKETAKQGVEILPDKDTKKSKKKVTFDLTPKETAKQPAPAPVPALPQNTPKSAPQKAPQQVPVPLPPKAPKLVMGYPPGYPTVGVCCCPPCYGGYGGGPCYCVQRRPVMCYDGCGRPACECPGGNRGSYPGQGRPVMGEWMW